MKNENSPAGSATGIDLSEIAALAHAAPQIWYGTCQIADGITDDSAVALIEACSPDTVLELIALARATPQHSVTEQAFAEWLAREMPAGTVIGDPAWWAPRILRAARAQPLASTAATQPERASVREQFEKWMKRHGHDVVSRLETGGKVYVSSFTRHAWTIWQGQAALAIPASTAASEQQASVSEADERKNFEKAIRNITLACDKSFRREKGRKGGYIQYEMGIYWSIWQARAALSGRATIPSDADERALFDAFMQTPAPDDYDASVDDAWLIWQEAWRAALTHRATTASGEIGCGGTGKFNDEMPCLGCDACLREGATTATVSYTTARGEAATRYHESFKHAHPLPAQWRWSELWDAMLAAAPDIATTAADQQASEAQRQDLALVIARLEQIKHIAGDFDVRNLAEEALVCAEALRTPGADQQGDTASASVIANVAATLERAGHTPEEAHTLAQQGAAQAQAGGLGGDHA